MTLYFTPITGGHDESWLIKRLDKNTNHIKFALIGSIWWINGLALLIRESAIDKNKFYENVSQKKHDEESLNNIFCSLLMAVDYFNTVLRINKLENIDNLMRVSIVSWYYGIYNAAQAMILSTDESSPQTHAHTADEWYSKFVSRNLIPFPFNYCLNSLVEKKYQLEIKEYTDFIPSYNKKPRDSAGAKTVCLSYLKDTAKWYFNEKYRYQIKSSKEFKEIDKADFKSKPAQMIRDKFLDKKKISFLHLAYRYRGKSNYRDAPYIAFANTLSVNSKEFINDLSTVLEDFITISLIYVKKRIGKKYFNEFLNDVIGSGRTSPINVTIVRNALCHKGSRVTAFEKFPSIDEQIVSYFFLLFLLYFSLLILLSVSSVRYLHILRKIKLNAGVA